MPFHLLTDFNLFVLLPFTLSRGVTINVFLVLKIISYCLLKGKYMYMVTKMLIKKNMKYIQSFEILNISCVFFCFVSGIQW